MNEPTLIPIELIQANPYQPRHAEDPAVIAEIAASIKRNGLMQVPTARRVNGHYQLAFGHTRLAAFKLLQETTMPLFERDLTDLQMFEMGVSENIKRRDLNPIEEGEAMQRYMTDFKKTSVEAAEFFGCSPEKVRSTVRLLKLPETLRAGVADGTITQNNARRLLTIQRVAPSQVKDVVKELKKGETVDPDAVIADALKSTGNSVQMWPSWRSDDEPLAGAHLWPIRLPAEKFPRSYLPEITVTQAAKIVGGNWESYHDKGVLQNRIDHFKAGCSMEDMPGFSSLNEVGVANHERLAHLISPPSCSSCPFYAKVKGDHFCTFKECYSRKTKAWQTNSLERAVEESGIQPYDHKTDGAFVEMISYSDAHKKIVQSKSPDLRLKKGQTYSGFDFAPDGYMVVVVGATAKKLNAADVTKRTSRDTTSTEYVIEQRRLSAIRKANEAAIYDFLWNVAAPAFLSVFNGATTLGFYQAMADRFCSGVPAEEPDKKATKAEKLQFYQRAILFSMFDDDLWEFITGEQKKPVRSLAKHLQGVATSWGVPLPKNWMDVATEADKAIAVTAVTAGEEK